jgi:hypothetical protein
MKLDDRLAKIGPRAATSVLSGTKKGSKSFSIEVTSPINDAGRAISASSSVPEHAAKAPVHPLTLLPPLSFLGRGGSSFVLGDKNEVVFEYAHRSTTPCTAFFY